MSMKEEKRTVEMTNKSWRELEIYLLMTNKSRIGEQKAWEEFAEEKNEDGTAKFRNAKGNAEYYKNLIAEIEIILKAIENKK